MRGVLQAIAHLLGNRHEQIAEDLEHDRIGIGADGMKAGARRHAAENQVAAQADGGTPAEVNNRGCGGITDDRRTVDERTAGQRLAIEERRVAPGARRVERHDRARCRHRDRIGLAACHSGDQAAWLVVCGAVCGAAGGTD